MNNTLAIFLEWIQVRYEFLIAYGGILALACFVVFMEFRQDAAKHKEQQRWIAGFDFSAMYFAEVKNRYPLRSTDEIADAFEQLRAYFLLCWQRSSLPVVMPSGLVDDCWQTMILNTRQYHKFCNCAFGRYLHHEPDGLVSDTFTTSNELVTRGRPRELM